MKHKGIYSRSKIKSKHQTLALNSNELSSYTRNDLSTLQNIPFRLSFEFLEALGIFHDREYVSSLPQDTSNNVLSLILSKGMRDLRR